MNLLKNKAVKANYNDIGVRAKSSVDEGLRTYMLGIYNYMALALVVTGLVAFFASTSEPLMNAIYGTGLKWIVMLAPLAFVMVLSFGIHKMQYSTAQIIFWAYAATMGLSLSYIFLAYTNTSIARTFFVTAGAFGALSLYGYTTKKDLTAMGKFLFMGLIGLVLASIVNIFVGSSALEFAVNIMGVLVFAGLTAYDTQRLKHEYYAFGANSKAALMGALSLYLDFVNMFMFMLQFLGNRE